MRFIIQYFLITLFFIIVTPIHANEYQGVVIKVVDGDTVDVILDNNITKRIRLLYIDAPEIKQKHGIESKIFLEKNILNNKVTVNPEKIDRYNRDLAQIFIFDREQEKAIFINAKMIKSGHAWVYKYNRSNKYLINLETHARLNKLGLWKYESPLEPWKYRKKNLNR